MMLKLLTALICTLSLASSASQKKVLILSSHGGYSHEAAAKTITKLLEEDYSCKTIFPITDYRPLGVKNSENIYNFLFARGWNRTLEALTFISTNLFKARASNFEAYFDRVLESEKPDLIISVAPIMNGPAIRSASKLSIPYLLTSLDDNPWIWLTDFQRPKGAHFKLAVPRCSSKNRVAIEKSGIEKEDIVEIGQLLRPEFQSPLPDRSELRLRHKIPAKRRVILILMGGAGSDVCVAYAKRIAKMRLGAHIIVCTGRYESLADDIERIVPHRSNSVQAMRFTNDMAELMALSDLMILKPGPSAVFEAVAIGSAPLLLDGTINPIAWERSNVDFVEKKKMGETVRRLKYLPKLVKRYLFDTKEREVALKALANEPLNRSCLAVKKVIEEMCPPDLDSKHKALIH